VRAADVGERATSLSSETHDPSSGPGIIGPAMPTATLTPHRPDVVLTAPRFLLDPLPCSHQHALRWLELSGSNFSLRSEPQDRPLTLFAPHG